MLQGRRSKSQDRVGDGVCRKVKPECTGDRQSTSSGIHYKPRSLRHGGGDEGITEGSSSLCPIGSATPLKSRARGLIGDSSRASSLGF